MQPFDPAKAIPGTILRDVDAASLQSSKNRLVQWRLDDQHSLLATNTPRWDMIEVSRDGVILAGHHGARAAAERSLSLDVLVRDLPIPSEGLILTIPVVSEPRP